MKKNTKTKQKSYMLAMVLMLMAVFGMTGVYVSEQRAEQKQLALEEQQKQEQLALEEQQKQEELALEEQQKQQLAETEEGIFMADNNVLSQNNDFLDDPEVISGNKMEVEPEKEIQGIKKEEVTEETGSAGTSEATQEDTSSQEQPEAVQETSSNKVQKELHFDAANEMSWPLQGNVIMNYSMEQTIYFATLDQYKYNPALIIQGSVNDKVLSVADGRITQIETSEETGCTVTMDLGDGYSAVYGQLKEVPFAVEDYVEAGEIIGYVSEPTKYYSLEGANLYFQITKDGESVDPMGFLQ